MQVGEGSRSAAQEEGTSRGIAGRVLGFMDEGQNKAGKMFERIAQKARRQVQQGASGQVSGFFQGSGVGADGVGCRSEV